MLCNCTVTNARHTYETYVQFRDIANLGVAEHEIVSEGLSLDCAINKRDAAIWQSLESNIASKSDTGLLRGGL